MRPLHESEELNFTSVKVLRRAEEPRWTDWLHRQARDLGGALWALADPPPAGRPGAGHSHVVHLPGAAARATLSHTLAEERRNAGTGELHAELSYDSWRRVGDPLVQNPGEEPSALIVAQVRCADPSREVEWDAWYDEEHLPDMMACGAFLAGSRWRREEPRPIGTNHLTVYEISGRSVNDAIEESAAIMPRLIAAGRKHPCHVGGLTWALQRCE